MENAREYRVVSTMIRGNLCYQAQYYQKFWIGGKWYSIKNKYRWSRKKKRSDKQIEKDKIKRSYGKRIHEPIDLNKSTSAISVSHCVEKIANAESKAEKKLWKKTKKQIESIN